MKRAKWCLSIKGKKYNNRYKYNIITIRHRDDMKKIRLISLLLIGLSQVNYGMKVEEDDENLVHAIKNDLADLVKDYIKNGGDANCTSKYTGSLIHVAARYNSMRVAHLLLENGANPNVCYYRYETPLHYAALQDFKEMGALLIKYGALIEAEDYYGNTPLHNAVCSKEKGVAQLLLEKGADWSIKNKMGETPYDIASPELKKIIETYAAIKKTK